MATFKVSSSGCTIADFTIAEVTRGNVAHELAKLGIYDISEKQLDKIMTHGSGAVFSFCRKTRQALPIVTIKDVTEEKQFQKALDIVNEYNRKRFALLNSVSIDTVISITLKVDRIAKAYGIDR